MVKGTIRPDWERITRRLVLPASCATSVGVRDVAALICDDKRALTRALSWRCR